MLEFSESGHQYLMFFLDVENVYNGYHVTFLKNPLKLEWFVCSLMLQWDCKWLVGRSRLNGYLNTALEH